MIELHLEMVKDSGAAALHHLKGYHRQK